MADPDPDFLLAGAHRILLVDWPKPTLARRLLAAGFEVFSYSPDGFKHAGIAAEATESGASYEPRNGESGVLVFEPCEAPASVDIANVFRPVEELADIIETVASPLAASVIWLHPPTVRDDGAELAAAAGMSFMQDVDIADVAERRRVQH